MIAMVTKTEVKSTFSAVQLPRQVIQRLEDFSNTEFSKKKGLTNKTQVARAACLEFLEKYAVENDTTRFVLPSLEDDELRIDVHIFNDRVVCNRCITDKEKCKHVEALYKDKEVKSHLKKSKIILPKR